MEFKEIAKNFPQYIITACGAVSVGMCLGWTSITEEEILYQDYPYEFTIYDNDFSWIVSLFALGAACICIPMEFLINAVGRKYPMLLLGLPFTIGWALLIWTKIVELMYIARFILGLAAGGYFIVVPVYANEITPEDYRGTIGPLFQLMITFGILLVFMFGWLLKTFVTSLISGAIPILLSLILVIMPESPIYLARKGKIEEAKKSIQFFHSKKYDCTQELKKIQNESEEFEKKKLAFSQTVSKSIGRKALLIILGLMVFQQLSGIFSIIFYTDRILKYTDGGPDSQVSTVVVGSILFIATLSSLFIVLHVGRRILLLISGVVMAICTSLVGYYFHTLFKGDSVKGLEYLPLISLCIFVIAFALGYGLVPWILINEIFPTEIKGVAYSIAGTFQWILAFIATKSFASVSDEFEHSYSFWVYSAITIIGCIFVIVFLPETKGKSLTENQKLFGVKPVDSKSLSKIQILLGNKKGNK